MCGIFGIALRQGAGMAPDTVRNLLANLYVFSESRGKESAGLHVYLPDAACAWTLKGAQPASVLLHTEAYDEALTDGLALAYGEGAPGLLAQPLIALAHSRLVTNGTSALDRNNQPVRFGAVTMIHNGIVVNVDKLWQANPDLQRKAEVDTEVMAALLDRGLRAGTFDPVGATRVVFSQIKGAASVAWTHQAAPLLTLATNTGDLYAAALPDDAGLVFASERYILVNALEKTLGEEGASAIKANIEWVQAGNGLSLDLDVKGPAVRFGLAPDTLCGQSPCRMRAPAEHRDTGATGNQAPEAIVRHADESLVRYGEDRIRALRRCSCCVLPETFPFIEFDDKGVCNYCRSYKPRYAGMHPTETRTAFIESLEKYRRSGKEPDVLVPFSGGRDSSYGLHLIHEEFGLRPVTFTYDWGMVTDLARRNVARMCGQLGVQNILVSADIKAKRDNIRKNVAAWLKRPDLGMVPLFMAGDKHFFRVVNELKRQTGIALDLWCANPLENTDFKSGFCGVRPDFDKSRVDYLSMGRKAQLAAYYGTRFLTNPGYLNGSLMDTFGAFLAYYFEPRRDFYFIFDHFIWNEDEVNKTLLSTYDWELSPDSPSTWRIGDGTAPFYNYIYMTARGFSEFDTFRSNQIREGMLTREHALASITVENRPRTESLRWYLNTIGVDFNDTIRTINELDTMGLHR
jgi:glucosamine--fructose-6-phosphate aminotransferase (isomerizing)